MSEIYIYKYSQCEWNEKPFQIYSEIVERYSGTDKKRCPIRLELIFQLNGFIWWSRLCITYRETNVPWIKDLCIQKRLKASTFQACFLTQHKLKYKYSGVIFEYNVEHSSLTVDWVQRELQNAYAALESMPRNQMLLGVAECICL